MAVQDHWTIDYVNEKLTYTTAFVDGRPPEVNTVNELYSWLQDVFDEPAQMNRRIPMSAQTPTQYTLNYFVDDESIKALYGGSLQTNAWAKSGAAGITQLRWTSGSTDAPVAGDIGVTLTGGTSAATGTLLAIDTARQVAWVRNTSVAQFANNENVTGTGVDIQTETTSGIQSGETKWANAFSVGSKNPNTEIYIGQEDDYQGGRSYHTANPHERRIEKIASWWDVDVDFSASPNLIGGTGHFDVLVKVQEAGATIDGGRLAVFAREASRVYSHFELVGGVGNFVVPFASTGADLNAQLGLYNVPFDGRTGNDLEVGDVLENNTGTTPVGRLRAVVTAVTGGGAATGDFDYYLIGENEANGTLRQFANNDNVGVRGDTTDFDINGTPTAINGADDTQGITVTFANTQVDVDEDATDEEYACTIDCNNLPLISVYRRLMFLTCRGNQDGGSGAADTPDTLLPTPVSGVDEGSEFFRAVGDVVINYDGGTGTQVAEGDYVENSGATASGVVVSVTSGTTGVMVLTQVKGTFADNDQIARPTEHATNRVDAAGAPSTLVDNTGAPFGTFAGGRFFFARGVVPSNVAAADANNWETTDLGGTRRAPLTVRAITFAGLVANDRVMLTEVGTAGGDDIVENHNGIAAGGASVGDTTLTLDSAIAQERPSVNSWAHVVDSSSTVGLQLELYYTSASGTTVTLDSAAGLSGTATSTGDQETLNDTGAFTSYEANGFVRTGMVIRNVTDGSWCKVLRKATNDQLITTALQGGTDNTWESGDVWEANTVPVALVDADTIWFPLISNVATGATKTTTIKYVANRNLIARMRFSSPGVGGQRLDPFEQRNITLTDADLLVTAIRTADPIAA